MHENLANMAICEPSRVPDRPGGCHELSRLVVLEPASVATGSAPPRLSGSGHYVTESERSRRPKTSVASHARWNTSNRT
jgi:hypothetical protein